MADGTFPQIISKDNANNAVTNPIFVRLSDGADGSLIDVSGNLNVILASNNGVDIGDVDVMSVIPGVGATNLGKAVDSVAGVSDTGVAVIAVRDDALTTLTPIDGDYVGLRVDSTGALWVNNGGTTQIEVKVDDSAFTVGVSSVAGVGMLADETAPDSVDEGDIGIPRMTLDRKQLIVLADSTTDGQRLAINVAGEAQVDVGSHGLTNANAVPISKDNSANSSANPIFVQNVVESVITGEVHDYNTAVAIAGSGTSNHNYTVVNTMLLKSVIISASGRTKAEIQVGPVLTLATKAVVFTDEDGFGQVNFDPPIEVPNTTTGTVRVIRTNREGASQDLYSTIIGIDA